MAVPIIVLLLGFYFGASIRAEEPDDTGRLKAEVFLLQEAIKFDPVAGVAHANGAAVLRVQNVSKQPVILSLVDTWKVRLRNSRGETATVSFARDASRLSAHKDFAQIDPTQYLHYLVELRLSFIENKLSLWGNDTLGGTWQCHDIEPGAFTFQIAYAHTEIYPFEEKFVKERRDELFVGEFVTASKPLRLEIARPGEAR